MVPPPQTTRGTYRLAAFGHWLNLAAIAALGIAGATVDPMWWVGIPVLQAGVLWVVPDLPNFRAGVDEKERRRLRAAERAFCLEQLWAIPTPPPPSFGGKLAALFLRRAPTVWPEETYTAPGDDFARYREMREIVGRLREMIPLRNTRVTHADVERLEDVINAYLRILVACRPLASALEAATPHVLAREIADVDRRIADAGGDLRPVLVERRRILEQQAQRIPKLRATLELLHSRAEAITYQVKSLQSQVLADPGAEVQAVLDQMIERNDMLSDPLADLRGDQAVRELLETELADRPSSPRLSRRQLAAKAAGQKQGQ